MLLKTFDELKEGKCKVVTKQGKIFSGIYSEEFNNVFFAIPSTYEIIGYYQD